MRIELPHEPEIPRKHDIAPASESDVPPFPVSVVDENLDRLQRPAVGGPAHPRMEPKPAPEADEIKRSREPEHRPRRTREGVAVDTATLGTYSARGDTLACPLTTIQFQSRVCEVSHSFLKAPMPLIQTDLGI